MRLLRLGVLPSVLVLTCLTVGRPGAQAPTATALLDRYAHGEFDAVVATLGETKDLGDLYNSLKHDGPAWIDAAGPAEKSRRELVAATFAMEAARAGEWHDWKRVQRINLNAPTGGRGGGGGGGRRGAGGGGGGQLVQGLQRGGGVTESYLPPDALYWRPPAQLLEWGCAVFRSDATPRPIERWWQLAALAVAERAEDFEFLLGSPFEERGNPKDEMEHLAHVAARFPTERRFALAQGIALDWRSWPDDPKNVIAPSVIPGAPYPPLGVLEAQKVFESLQNDDEVGPEATLRLGVLRLREGASGEALKLFDRVDDSTRDQYLVYLARFFRGQALERARQFPEATRAYRSAHDTIPGAQSASPAPARRPLPSSTRISPSGRSRSTHGAAGRMPTIVSGLS